MQRLGRPNAREPVHTSAKAEPPHAFYGQCLHKFSEFKATGGRGADLIVGGYSRAVDIASASFQCDTSTRVIDIQTPSIFVDLRINVGRGAVASADGFGSMSIADLERLGAEQHCFAGITLVDTDVAGFQGSPVGTRYHAIDYQPPPRKNPNQWRIQTAWEQGGWVEWSARNDAFGQAAYIEHWATLEGSRGGEFLCLYRQDELRKGFLVVAGDHFCYILDRPPVAQLSPVTPGKDGHAADRGKLAPLLAAAAAAGDREQMILLLSLECSYGKIEWIREGEAEAEGGGGADGGGDAAKTKAKAKARWAIEASTYPWLEGTELAFPAEFSLDPSTLRATPREAAPPETSAAMENRSAEWALFENSFADEQLEAMFGAAAAGAAGKPSFGPPKPPKPELAAAAAAAAQYDEAAAVAIAAAAAAAAAEQAERDGDDDDDDEAQLMEGDDAVECTLNREDGESVVVVVRNTDTIAHIKCAVSVADPSVEPKSVVLACEGDDETLLDGTVVSSLLWPNCYELELEMTFLAEDAE